MTGTTVPVRALRYVRRRGAAEAAHADGHHGFTVSQDRFNLVDRSYATDLAPTVEALDMVISAGELDILA